MPEQAKHPILRGVKNMWAQCGGYNANPLKPYTALAMAQPLKGMSPDSPDDETRKPVPGAIFALIDKWSCGVQGLE